MAKTSCKKVQYYCNTDKKCKPIPDGYKVREDGILVSEGSLRKWFKGSKSKDGKGGWVNVVTGGTCASDEPGDDFGFTETSTFFGDSKDFAPNRGVDI